MSNELPPLPRAHHWLNGDLYRADQLREYGRACERAAYERAAQWIEGVAATDDGRLLLSQSFIAANLRALGADK